MSLHRSIDEIFNMNDDTLNEIIKFANYTNENLKQHKSSIMELKISNICACISQYMTKLPNIEASLTVTDNIVLYNLRHLMEGFMIVFEFQINEKLKNYEKFVIKKEKRSKQTHTEIAITLPETKRKKTKAHTVTPMVEQRRSLRDIWGEIQDIHLGMDLEGPEECITLPEPAAGPFNRLQEQFDDDVNELAIFLQGSELLSDMRESRDTRCSYIDPSVFPFLRDERQSLAPLSHETTLGHSFLMNWTLRPDVLQVPPAAAQEDAATSMDQTMIQRFRLVDYINEIMESPRRQLKTLIRKDSNQNLFRITWIISAETLNKKFQNRIFKQTNSIPPPNIFQKILDKEIESEIPDLMICLMSYTKRRSSATVFQIRPLADDQYILKGLPEEVCTMQQPIPPISEEHREPQTVQVQEEFQDIQVPEEIRHSIEVGGIRISGEVIREEIQPEKSMRMDVEKEIMEAGLVAQTGQFDDIRQTLSSSQFQLGSEINEYIPRLSILGQSLDSIMERTENITDLLESTVLTASTVLSEEFCNSLMSKLHLMWDIREVKFTDLCPKHETLRNIAAKTFLNLLYLWRSKKVEIEQQGEDPDNIILKPGLVEEYVME